MPLITEEVAKLMTPSQLIIGDQASTQQAGYQSACNEAVILRMSFEVLGAILRPVLNTGK